MTSKLNPLGSWLMTKIVLTLSLQWRMPTMMLIKPQVPSREAPVSKTSSLGVMNNLYFQLQVKTA